MNGLEIRSNQNGVQLGVGKDEMVDVDVSCPKAGRIQRGAADDHQEGLVRARCGIGASHREYL